MSPSEPITVAVIDDNRLVRDGLAALLNKVPNVSATAWERADDLVVTPAPSVVLLDVGVGGEESVRVVASLAASLPETKIIAMDLIPVREEIMELVNAGVSGFVMKDATFDDFIATIYAVASGEKVLPPQMAESLFAQLAKEGRNRRNQEVLDDVRMTPRELEVIALISEGLSNKEIAQRLGIAPHTVKSHVRNDVSNANTAAQTHDLMTTSDGTRALLRDGRLIVPGARDVASHPGDAPRGERPPQGRT